MNINILIKFRSIDEGKEGQKKMYNLNIFKLKNCKINIF